MEDNRQHVTRKELYTVAVNVCTLIAFVAFTRAVSSQKAQDYVKIYVALWALAVLAYYAYKLRTTRSDSRPSDLSG